MKPTMNSVGPRPQKAFANRLFKQTAVAAVSATVLLATAPLAFAQRISVIPDTAIERLLSDYSRPIFKAAGLGTQNVTMRIVKHDSFNAFVLDGQNVFVHTGALMQSETPNQVIGVI